MSSPPFTPNETLPEDTGVVSIFPNQERTFREIIESWLLFEHSNTGHHEFVADTTVNIDGDSTWVVGSVAYDTTLGKFRFVTGIGPVTWLSIGPEFPSGTKMLFGQTTPPAGWTKVTDAAYQDAAIRCTTGSVGPTGGTAAFETAFAARTIVQANLPAAALALSETVVTSLSVSLPSQGTASGSGGGPVCVLSTASVVGNETAVTAALGGSSTAMDFDVKFVDVVLATKA